MMTECTRVHTPVFEEAQAWHRFLSILVSWKGTPYRHAQCSRGGGADCLLYIAACLTEAGYLKEVSYDYYTRDWHIHGYQELVLESIRSYKKNGKFAEGYTLLELPGDEVTMQGDFLGISTTKKKFTNHTAVFIGEGRIMHAVHPKGVCVGDYTLWHRRVTHTFRLVKGVV